MRKLYYYLKENNKTNVIGQDFLNTAFSTEKKRLEKYDLALKNSKSGTPLIRVDWDGNRSYYGRSGIILELTSEGKDTYSWPAIIFVNMGVFMGCMLSIVGFIFGVLFNIAMTRYLPMIQISDTALTIPR